MTLVACLKQAGLVSGTGGRGGRGGRGGGRGGCRGGKRGASAVEFIDSRSLHSIFTKYSLFIRKILVQEYLHA